MTTSLVTTHYSDDSFWSKTKRLLKRLGYELVEKILWLYYALQQKETPAWAKSVIVGALGYLIWPVDAVPDAPPEAWPTTLRCWAVRSRRSRCTSRHESKHWPPKNLRSGSAHGLAPDNPPNRPSC